MSCPSCFQGSVHEDETPKGEIIKLHGLDTYVARPASGNPPKGIIVIIPDAFGFDFVNSRVLADHYAAKGDFLVYLPDFMLGHSAPQYMLDSMRIFLSPGFNLAKPYHLFRGLYGYLTFKQHNDFPKSFPIVKEFFTRLRADKGQSSASPPANPQAGTGKKDSGLKIGVAAFCWGGKHAVLLAQKSEEPSAKLIDAIFTGHPSSLLIPTEIQNLDPTIPVSFAIPEKDNHITPEKAKLIREIIEAPDRPGKGEVVVYEDCGHGFCIRGDLKYKDGEIARQAEKAEDQAVGWFEKYLA